MKIKRIIEIDEDTLKFIQELREVIIPLRSGKTLLKNVIEAIKFSKPYDDSGDCISRSALKAGLEAYRHTRNYKSDEDEAQNNLLDNILEDIDNAPPVCGNNPKWCERCVSKGKCKSTRPQGEWIKEPNGKTTDIYRCSICGRSIMLCKNADLSKYPFCHCGAKMKGGAEK